MHSVNSQIMLYINPNLEGLGYAPRKSLKIMLSMIEFESIFSSVSDNVVLTDSYVENPFYL